MYSNHKHFGRLCVNWKRESKKTKKTHVQQKKKNVTQMDKLYGLQRQFVKDGMNRPQYKNYIQEKINNDMFYYRKLSEKDVSKLHQRYRRLLQEKNNRVNELLTYRKRNNRQNKLFKEKKKKIIDEQKSKMIDQLLKVMDKRDIKNLIQKYGWKMAIGIFFYYLIRDVSLYIVLPWLIAKNYIF